jgi:DNA-binding IclR family transcriptional regulator
MQESSKKDFVEALARGLEVIRSFDRLHLKQTISQISERTLLARPTVLRLLITLEELGYVRSQDNHYSLTPKVVDLGMAYVSSLGLYGAAKPHMENLSKEVDQSVSLAELDGSDIVYTGRVEVPKIVSVGVTVGARLPSASTALGRVLLAAVPDAELHNVLSTPSMSMYIPRTRFTAEQIRPQIQLCANRAGQKATKICNMACKPLRLRSAAKTAESLQQLDWEPIPPKLVRRLFANDICHYFLKPLAALRTTGANAGNCQPQNLL